MADGRETKRERREVAKQRRMEELRRRQRKDAMRKFWYAGISVLVIGGIIALVLVLGGKGKANVKELNRLAAAAGCNELQNPADEGSSHVQAPQRVTYKTNPPSSGNHYSATSFTGVLPNPLPSGLQDENLVHNMEHGHAIIWYKPDVAGELLDKLKALVRKDARRLILVPRADMQTAFAFTAWGHLLTCPTASDEVVPVAQKFADTYKAHGPEGTGDAPGTPFSGS